MREQLKSLPPRYRARITLLLQQARFVPVYLSIVPICARAHGGAPSMPRFRCFFIDQADRVGGFESYDGADRIDAVDRDGELLRHDPKAVAVTVWDTGQFIARISREIGRDPT